jgi:membrane-associated protein
MQILDWIIHLDQHLGELITQMGGWFYALVVAIIFGETGLVIAPFLPGDSLLFAVGAFAAKPEYNLNVWYLLPMLIVAAVIGDAVNYAVGKWVGPQVFKRDTGWLLNKQHLYRAQAFYDKHGGKAIVLARFLPILRTFAPFVAGIGGMQYGKFWMYNVVGGIAWVSLFLLGGYVFGNQEIVKRNFHVVILAIVAISALPVAYEYWKARQKLDRS